MNQTSAIAEKITYEISDPALLKIKIMLPIKE